MITKLIELARLSAKLKITIKFNFKNKLLLELQRRFLK